MVAEAVWWLFPLTFGLCSVRRPSVLADGAVPRQRPEHHLWWICLLIFRWSDVKEDRVQDCKYNMQISCECVTSCWGVFGACCPIYWCLITLWSFLWRRACLKLLPVPLENWKPLHTWLQGSRSKEWEVTFFLIYNSSASSVFWSAHVLDLMFLCHSFKQISSN